jgi:hypothetical protein
MFTYMESRVSVELMSEQFTRVLEPTAEMHHSLARQLSHRFGVHTDWVLLWRIWAGVGIRSLTNIKPDRSAAPTLDYAG